jgi:hypothetical protein
MNIAAKTTDATAGDLRYQLSFGQTARECAVHGATMIIKVGVQGRVILGPMGGPGKVEVPLRYAVVREGSFPMPSRSELDAYVVYVGFDEIGDKNEKKPPAKKTATRQQ